MTRRPFRQSATERREHLVILGGLAALALLIIVAVVLAAMAFQ